MAQELHIYKPGKQVVISDTVGFTEALIELAEKLTEVMEFVSIECEHDDEFELYETCGT